MHSSDDLWYSDQHAGQMGSMTPGGFGYSDDDWAKPFACAMCAYGTVRSVENEFIDINCRKHREKLSQSSETSVGRQTAFRATCRQSYARMCREVLVSDKHM